MTVVVEVVVEVGVGGGLGGVVAEGSVLLEGLVEGAFGGGLVAVEGIEGVRGGGGLGEAGEELGGGWELGRGGGFPGAVAAVVFELFLVLFGGLSVGLVEEVGLGLGVSAELPAEEGDAFDEEVIERGLGVELVAEVGEEVGVFLAVGFGDEGALV
jgi:hypothetical protein